MDKTELKNYLKDARAELAEWEEKYANDCSEYNRCQCHYWQGQVDAIISVLE